MHILVSFSSRRASGHAFCRAHTWILENGCFSKYHGYIPAKDLSTICLRSLYVPRSSMSLHTPVSICFAIWFFMTQGHPILCLGSITWVARQRQLYEAQTFLPSVSSMQDLGYTYTGLDYRVRSLRTFPEQWRSKCKKSMRNEM